MAVKQRSSEGINIKKSWSLKKARMVTMQTCGCFLEDIYDYEYYNNICKNIEKRKSLENFKLDEYMWTGFTNTLEENRQLVFETCKEYGVNKCESYFLSIKFLWSSLKKFRGKFFRLMNGKEDKTDYDSTPLRAAVNSLIYRIEEIMPHEDYMFSVEAADNQLGYFRKQCAWETARYLAEDSGVIFHAKLSL